MKIQLRSAIVTFAVVAVIGSGIVVPAAAKVAAPASTGSAVQVLKNRDCGWGIKTKYHSCDLAYSLVIDWLRQGNYPEKMRSVFSPNSGKRYDVKCTGVKTITCKSNKGSVTFKPQSVPPQYKCGLVSVDPNRWGWAWLGSSCEFVLAAIQSYKAGPADPSTLTVADPSNGMVYEMVCFRVDYGPLMMCLSGKKAVLFRYEWD